MEIKFWQDNDDYFYKAPLKLNPLKVCVINIIALRDIYMGHLCGPYSLDMSLRQ